MKISDKFGVKTGNGLFYQYLATITGCLSIICTGMHFGWPSPSLPQFLQPNSHIPMTEDDGSWIATMPCIGAASGSILAAYIVDKIGRKTCMLITSPLYVATWIMVAYSSSILMLNIARFLAGTADGIAFTAFPMYLGEISNSRIRGLLGSSIQVSMTIGMLLINVIGSYLNVTHTALISAVVPALHFITFFFMPESPYYLIMKNNINAAKQSLQKLYSREDVVAEFNEVNECVQLDLKDNGKCWELFTNRSNRKAVVIVFGLRAVQQLSGTNAITFYAQIIFEESGGDISPILASITYFALQIVIAIIASLLVDKVGRRPLLICSITGSGAALLLEGLYFYFSENTHANISDMKYIPLVALLAYVIIFNLGMGTIPVLLLGEMFPTNVKAFALCLADIFFGIVVTIVSKCFQILKDNLGMYVPFFVFTCSCGIGLIFILLYVPETKGRTLEEIQCYLRGEPKKKEESDTPL